jgi:hypothetical protein
LGIVLALFLPFSLGAVGANAASENAKTSCFSNHLTEALNGGSYSSHQLKTIDDVLRAFSEGLIPDLQVNSHLQAFEIYRRIRFGNPNTELNPGTLKEIAKELAKHPELEKEPFRNFKLETVDRSYLVTKELAAFLDSQVSSAGQVRSNLFQVEANSGLWKKVLQYEEPKFPKAEPLSRDAAPEQKQAYREKAKKQKEKLQAHWSSFLDERLGPELRSQLSDEKVSGEDRAKLLFEVLKKQRKEIAAQKKDIKPVSQAMIDLIHTIGYHDPVIARAWKSPDGMERIRAYKRVLAERDLFAMSLGFEGHFEQVLREIGNPAGVWMPTGVTSVHKATEALEKLEQRVIAGAVLAKNASTIRTVRHLSLVESPLRSCLGGSDCSSRTYLTRALDPNYHYFTIMDENGHSSGQITLVLGDAQIHGHPVKAAFIDKVQNVPNMDLPPMIEAIRRSVEEKGYKLILPNDVGDGNGISNEELTRSFIDRSIKTDASQPVTGFQPHSHGYDFPNKYSRADQKLDSHVIAPLELQQDIKLTAGEITVPWKLPPDTKLDIDQFVKATYDLKKSPKLEDRLKYIETMKVLKSYGPKIDPDFESTLKKWILNPQEEFLLRKQVLLYYWTNNIIRLNALVSYFHPDEKARLLQTFLDTPRYRDRIFNFQSQHIERNLIEFFIAVRHYPQVRDELIDAYASKTGDGLRSLLRRAMDAPDLSDFVADQLSRSTRASIDSFNAEELVRAQKIVQPTSLGSRYWDDLATFSLANVQEEAKFSKELSQLLDSKEALHRSIGFQLVEKAKNFGRLQSAAKAFESLLNFQKSNPKLSSLDRAIPAWLKLPNVAPELKASVLLPYFLESENTRYARYVQKAKIREGDATTSKLLEKVGPTQYKSSHINSRINSPAATVASVALFGSAVTGLLEYEKKKETGCHLFSNGVDPKTTDVGREVDDSEFWSRPDPKACRKYMEQFCYKGEMEVYDLHRDRQFCDQIQNLIPIKTLLILREKGASVDSVALEFAAHMQTRSQIECIKQLSQEQLSLEFFYQNYTSLCDWKKVH